MLGARVLADSGSEVLGVAEQIARSHHERWDGDGYPDGLAGEAIPLVARIVYVADVFDVLVHERPYKEAWTVEDAAREIRAGAGTQFDPDVVAAFDALGAGSWTRGPRVQLAPGAQARRRVRAMTTLTWGESSPTAVAAIAALALAGCGADSSLPCAGPPRSVPLPSGRATSSRPTAGSATRRSSARDAPQRRLSPGGPPDATERRRRPAARRRRRRRGVPERRSDARRRRR